MPKKGEYIRFKYYERKIKVPFLIYTDFVKILVPADNRRQNPEGYFMSKYQKHVACSFSYILVRLYDKFKRPFKSLLS